MQIELLRAALETDQPRAPEEQEVAKKQRRKPHVTSAKMMLYVHQKKIEGYLLMLLAKLKEAVL